MHVASSARPSARVGGGELGASGGGSTITMQYVKNILVQKAQQLDDAEERDAAYEEATTTTLDRKLKEMKLAIGLEKKYTKDEILLGYLNIAGFGGSVYGIQAAAQYYYDMNAADLTVAQAASLIAIVKYPDSPQPRRRPRTYEAQQGPTRRHHQGDARRGYIDQTPGARRPSPGHRRATCT